MLFICTGNQCRSPMAEALLRDKLPPGCAVTVASAGTIGDGTPPPDHAARVMADLGLDIAGRPSRRLDEEMLDGADVVITMTRDHLLAVATTHPPALDRSFTLTDLLRRAGQAGGPLPSESLSQWARRMSAGRTPQKILTAPAADDIADPMGGEVRDYERAARLLDRLTTELAAVLCSPTPLTGGSSTEAPDARRGLRSWLGGRPDHRPR